MSRWIASLGLVVALTGCPEEQGPMEKVGESMDDAAKDVERNVEDAVDEDGPLERAGEALDEAAEDAKEAWEEATSGDGSKSGEQSPDDGKTEEPAPDDSKS